LTLFGIEAAEKTIDSKLGAVGQKNRIRKFMS